MTRRNARKQGWVFPLFSPDSDDRLSLNFHRFVIWYRSCGTQSVGLGQYCLPKGSNGFKDDINIFSTKVWALFCIRPLCTGNHPSDVNGQPSRGGDQFLNEAVHHFLMAHSYCSPEHVSGFSWNVAINVAMRAQSLLFFSFSFRFFITH
jgi:hypothetical protein